MSATCESEGDTHAPVETAMTWTRLIDDHLAIDTLADALLAVTRGPVDAPRAATLLGELATLIRDHMTQEAVALADTLDAAARDRHHAAAATAMRDVERLREDWTLYLYRWTPDAVAARWTVFATDTAIMMASVRERVAHETTILYSLAVHYGTLEPGSGVE